MNKKINFNKIKEEILKDSKKFIKTNGWNENLINLISKNKKYGSKINIIFPKGYISILEYYLEHLNKEMIKYSKKVKLKKISTTIKIKEIILLRLKNYKKERSIIKKTYFSLFLPTHHSVAINSLFNTVDTIWRVAGDDSTDFNYYTKRIILSKIYSSTILYWINNNDLEKTEIFIEKQLKKVSKIPLIKNKLKRITKNIPSAFNFIKNFVLVRQ